MHFEIRPASNPVVEISSDPNPVVEISSDPDPNPVVEISSDPDPNPVVEISSDPNPVVEISSEKVSEEGRIGIRFSNKVGSGGQNKVIRICFKNMVESGPGFPIKVGSSFENKFGSDF